jgi:hypothetical protein
MQIKYDFAGSTDMWSTLAGGHLMKVVNLTGFTVLGITKYYESFSFARFEVLTDVLEITGVIRLTRTSGLVNKS